MPDGTPVKSLFEYARGMGKSIGVVVTSSVTDATPAAFMAHVDNRRKQADIAEQIVKTDIDVLIGGGWGYLAPTSKVGGRRKDDKDLLRVLDFDAAIGAALNFAEHRDRTLIIVTSDHEAGGFAVHDGSIDNREVSKSTFTTGGHTASMVPIFAAGPSSAEFGGILDNARVGQLLIDLLLKRILKIEIGFRAV